MASHPTDQWIDQITEAITLFEDLSQSLHQSVATESLAVNAIQYHLNAIGEKTEYSPLLVETCERDTFARTVTQRLKDDKPVSSLLYGAGCTQLDLEQFNQFNSAKQQLKAAILEYRTLKNGKRGRISTMARSLVQDKLVPAKLAKTRDYAASLLNAYDLLSCYAPLSLITEPVKTIAFSWQKKPAQVSRTNVNEVLAVAQRQSSQAVLNVAEQKLEGFEGHRPLAIKRVVGKPRLYANVRYVDGRLEKHSVRGFLLLHQKYLPEIRWPKTLPQEELQPREPYQKSRNGTVASNSLIDALNVYEYSRTPEDQ